MTAPEPDSLTVFRLPRSHGHAQLDTFAWAAVRPASLRPRVEQFVRAAQGDAAPHLLLTGGPGIGKTHLSVGVYRAVVGAVGTVRATWLNVPAFCERVKQGYGDGTDAAWDDVEAARRLVVLDDLFGRDLTQHEANAIVYRIIDLAYTNGAAVLATMNQAVEELAARLPPHEISRLLAGATVIPMTADHDWRRT